MTKYHYIIWDEAVYLGIGKYLYSLGNAGLWESIRPLGLPLVIGLFWKLKLNYIFFADIVELIFSLGCIYMTYKIASMHFSEKEALIASLLVMITPVFYFSSLKVMTEIPALFFVLMGVYYFMKKNYSIAGLFVGISFLFRYPSGIMLPTLLLFLLYTYVKEGNFKEFAINSAKICGFFIIAIVPLLIFNYYFYGDVFKPILEASMHQGNIANSVGGFFLNIFFYPLFLFKDNPFLIFFLLGIYYFVKMKKHLFLFLAFIPLLYLTYIVNKQLRFAIIILPFLAILSAYSLFAVYKKAKKNMVYKRAFYIFAAVCLMIIMVSDFYVYHSWFPYYKPAMVSEFYTYFPEGFKGPILTADPVFAAYSDLKFIPYYFSVWSAHPIYDKYINSSTAIVYTPSSFPCYDKECGILKSELEDKIWQNRLVFSKTYWDKFYIYLSKDLK